MLIGARTGAWKTSLTPLPYDAEVEWLESDGYQLIDTGYHINANSVIFANYKPNMLGVSNSVFGSCALYQERYATVVWNQNSPGVAFHLATNYGMIDTGYIFNDHGYFQSKFNEITVDYGLKKITYGNYSEEFSCPDMEGSSPYNLFLFGTQRRELMNFNFMYYGKVKRFKHSISGVDVTDFIPVRFTNEDNVTEGAMFDRASGTLFRNTGTGSFTIGPDIT